MKKIIFIFLGLILFVSASENLFAQRRNLTIILLRHAEKDLTDRNRANPELSAEGRERAERLIEAIGKYKPDLIYSTNYKRTRATALPLAEKVDKRYRIPIRAYNFDKLDEFADELLKSGARVVVVVGHNTTTTELTNLLIKQERYKALDENEYDKVFVVEVRKKRKVRRFSERGGRLFELKDGTK